MKKVSLFFSVLTAFVLAASLSSCTKSTSGKVTFWYGQSVSLTANAIGVTSFTFYLNNEIIGSSSANVYSVNTPTCGSGGAVTKTMDLDAEESATFNYKVVDENGDTWWEGTVKIEDGGCINQQLSI
jgi:hypothetical protein